MRNSGYDPGTRSHAGLLVIQRTRGYNGRRLVASTISAGERRPHEPHP